MKKTYHGSCHCKAVTFEAEIDLDQGTGKCNCTICWKQRMWTASQIDPADFRLLSGAESLTDYNKSGDWGEVHHFFCARCGTPTHGRSRLEELGGKETYSVSVAVLDDLPVEELMSAPVRLMDGLHDNWWNPPAETRHL
jgi:hypothetical protein